MSRILAAPRAALSSSRSRMLLPGCAGSRGCFGDDAHILSDGSLRPWSFSSLCFCQDLTARCYVLECPRASFARPAPSILTVGQQLLFLTEFLPLPLFLDFFGFYEEEISYFKHYKVYRPLGVGDVSKRGCLLCWI